MTRQTPAYNPETLGAWRGALLAAFVFHLFILGLYTFEVIPQEYKREGYVFWFHQGGDDYGYYEQTQNIIQRQFSPNKFPLGFPLLTVPVMLIVQPDDHDALVEPVALLWAVAMFPIGQGLLAWLAQKITGKRFLSLLIVWIWTAFPLTTYLILRVIWNAEMAETTSVHFTWAQMLSDGPAALFTLLVFCALWQADASGYPVRWIMLVGALGGFLMMIRLTGILTVGAVGLILLKQRQWRALVLMIVTTLLFFTPQMVYNAHFFGSPFTSGYSVLDELPPQGLLSVSYLGDAIGKIWERSGVLFPIGLIGICACVAAALRDLRRTSPLGAWIIGLWLAGYLGFYSVYYYSWTGSLLRFMIPLLPALAFLIAVVIGLFLRRVASWRT